MIFFHYKSYDRALMLGIHAIDTFISTIIYVTNSIYNPPFKKKSRYN